MSELRDLYQQLILDHYKSPRNYRKVEDYSHVAHGHNPLCGDRIEVFLKMNGDRVEDISFQGSGCAISTASASLMTTAIKGKTKSEVKAIFKKFHNMVTTDETPDPESLGKLVVFAGVREFPVRVKCATLAWHTTHAALKDDKDQTVTTE